MSEESNEFVVDKGHWPDGPWKDEPDKLVWVDEATNLDCMIVRGRTGALCGYVGVGPDHPLHGVDADVADLDAHGGVNYSEGCQDVICHTPAEGRAHDVWWFGFDCAHYNDVTPAIEFWMATNSDPDGPFGRTYKDIEYVRAEVTSLAEQLADN